MAFLDVNKKMLAYLLTNGTHEDELKRFFRDSRAQLILRGARMQNLPRRSSDRIRAICDQLPSKTDETLRDWFSRNISLSDPLSREDVYTYLQLRFDQSEDIQNADIKLIARSILIYLFEENPTQELLSFLRHPSGMTFKSEEVPPSSQLSDNLDSARGSEITTEVENDLTSQPLDYQLTELLSAIIINDQTSIDEALAPFPFPTRVLVDALLSIRCGDQDTASKHLGMLDASSLEAEHIKLALTRVESKSGELSSVNGVQLLIPQPLEKVPVSDAYDIIGIYTNESELGAIFVRPLALRIEEKIYLLNRDDRMALFPESGDVMTHRSEIRHQPQRRDLLHWKVSEHEKSTGKTRFRLEAELNPILDVYPLSVPSFDPDEVRERIKQIASEQRLPSSQQAYFILSDGVVLLSPKAVDISRDDAYDSAWQALDTLNTWLIEGRQYCLDRPRHSNFSIDLSTPESYLRRVLKSLEADQKASLSKTQRRELFELFRASSSSENRPRAERIISSLEQTSLTDEDLDTVLNLLNSREEVRVRVQEMLDAGYASLKSGFSGLQAEIETLKSRKSQLKAEIKEMERNNKQSAEATSSIVEQAFSKSIQEGLTTLANVEIFRALSGGNSLGGNEKLHQAIPLSTTIDTWMLDRPLTISEALNRLLSLGLNRRQAIILIELFSLSLRSGALFILKGNRARQYAQTLARIDNQLTGVLDIPMGLSSGASFRDVLGTMLHVDRFVVLNADLSPMEIYAARIFDGVYEAACEDGILLKSHLLTCIGGDMGLPLPNMLRQISVAIDLDQEWDSGTRNLEEIDISSIPLVASLRVKIVEALSDIKPEYRTQVEKALVAAIYVPEPPEAI